jgi:hypothetical protein
MAVPVMQEVAEPAVNEVFRAARLADLDLPAADAVGAAVDRAGAEAAARLQRA